MTFKITNKWIYFFIVHAACLLGCLPLSKKAGNELTAQSVRDIIFNSNWVDTVGYKGFDFRPDTFNVLSYGARNDGIVLTTDHLQKALDACGAAGGGVVLLPDGKYLTGSLFVKSNTHVLISDNAMILGSYDLADYPEQKTRIQGTEIDWPMALINVNNAGNVRISGKGIIHGHGRIHWARYEYMLPLYLENDLRWILNYDCKRPRMLVVDNSRNVHISGITLMESPFWTIHLLYSNALTLDGVKVRNYTDVHAPSSDGIDIDSSRDILVQNCDVEAQDDNFCFKSGRDADGLRVNRPTEYVVLRNNRTGPGAGLVTFGSETSGGIRNVYITDMKAEGTRRGIRFKTARTRGGVVENILIENIEIDSAWRVFEILADWNPLTHSPVLPERYNFDSIPEYWRTFMLPVEPPEKGICYIRNIEINNLKATNCREAFHVVGDEVAPLENFVFNNLSIQSGTGGIIKDARDWKLNNASFIFADRKAIQLNNCSEMDEVFYKIPE
jgi:hypothetical protein